ncbi:MAG: hypothetical protein CL583_12740 [Alteromonadaceae bacterium]|nr:hypothetical protein [Alteromonadaceae bacterium]|tara:strand:+ start:4408 stop:5631 length:1224 start_codon:yes stop_codon:yes gene_type:complete
MTNQYISPANKKTSVFRKVSVLALALSAFGSASAFAVPTISDVSGQLLQGATLTVSGQGFTNADVDLAIKHGNGRSNYSLFGDEPSLLNILDPRRALWMATGSSWADPLWPALLSAKEDPIKNYVYAGIGKTYNSWLAPLNNIRNKRLYVSWQYVPSESPGHSGGSNKFIRVWDNHSGTDTRISWTQMHMTYSGMARPSWERWSGTPGQWNHMELWVDGVKGEIVASVNGEVAHRVTDFKKVDQGLGLNLKLLGFDPSNSRPYTNMMTVVDKIYAATSRARVMVSDEPKWVDARHTGEVQLLKSWTPSEIRVNLDVSDIGVSKARYLYVVDENGTANAAGFRLCAGCAPQEEPAPSSPTSPSSSPTVPSSSPSTSSPTTSTTIRHSTTSTQAPSSSPTTSSSTSSRG